MNKLKVKSDKNVSFINVTDKTIYLGSDDGLILELPPSGLTLDTENTVTAAGVIHGWINLTIDRLSYTSKGYSLITDILKEYENGVIVGDKELADAYIGRVFVPVAVESDSARAPDGGQLFYIDRFSIN